VRPRVQIPGPGPSFEYKPDSRGHTFATMESRHLATYVATDVASHAGSHETQPSASCRFPSSARDNVFLDRVALPGEVELGPADPTKSTQAFGSDYLTECFVERAAVAFSLPRDSIPTQSSTRSNHSLTSAEHNPNCSPHARCPARSNTANVALG
jgi:hypothetical protein